MILPALMVILVLGALFLAATMDDVDPPPLTRLGKQLANAFKRVLAKVRR